MSLRDLTEQFRVTLTEEGGAEYAAKMAQKANRRNDRGAVSYWRGVFANAKKAIDTAAGHPGGAHAHTPGHDAHAKKEPAPKKSFKDRLTAVKNAVVGGAAKAVTGAAHAIKGLPAASAKLVTDSKYRKDVAHHFGAEIKKVAAKVAMNAIDEVAEVVKAGVVLGKVAAGKKVGEEDKHILKQGAKALATTLLGTIALGGLAHVTASALATHFAAETAVKSVGKAALFASAITEEETRAATANWAKSVIAGIQKGFQSIGSMSDEELTALLKSAHS